MLSLKIGLIAGLVSIARWTWVYSRLAKWWQNPVGRTMVTEAALIGLLFVPQILSLFFDLNRLDSYIAAWADVALIGLVTPVMEWRTTVFKRMGPSPDRKHRDQWRAMFAKYAKFLASPDRKHCDQWRAILSIFAKYASHAPWLGRKHRDPVEAPSPQDKEY